MPTSSANFADVFARLHTLEKLQLLVLVNNSLPSGHAPVSSLAGKLSAIFLVSVWGCTPLESGFVSESLSGIVGIPMS